MKLTLRRSTAGKGSLRVQEYLQDTFITVIILRNLPLTAPQIRARINASKSFTSQTICVFVRCRQEAIVSVGGTGFLCKKTTYKALGRVASILLKGQLHHEFLSLSKDVSCVRWQAETDTSPCPPASQTSVCVRDRQREGDQAIHSAATLNQKNGNLAFWMTGDAELPWRSNRNGAFSPRVQERQRQHQGVEEPPWLH